MYISPYDLAIECDDPVGLLIKIDHPATKGWQKTYKRQWETAKSIALLPKVKGTLPPVRILIKKGATPVYYTLVRGKIGGPLQHVQKRTFCVGWVCEGEKMLVYISEDGEILVHSPAKE